MKIGVIADDFTGASDIALTLALGGMTTVQYVGVPSGASGDVDAGVVALKSRTIAAGDAVAQSLAAQTDWPIAHIEFRTVDRGEDAIVAAMPADAAMEVEGTGIAVALKSGNFGGPGFFSESLHLMEQST